MSNGRPLAVDCALVSPLRADGAPRPEAVRHDGGVMEATKRRKRVHYSDVVEARRCHFLPVVFETTGRWDDDAYHFVRQLAKARARSSPAAVRQAAYHTFLNRWTALLSAAAQQAYVRSVLSPSSDVGVCFDEPTPVLSELLETVVSATA